LISPCLDRNFMKNILTIAKWEITRLRSRFTGKSKWVILPVILLAVFLSFSIYHQDFVICKGFFTIGIAPDGPTVSDKRFNSIIVDEKEGIQLLRAKKIDLFINNQTVIKRADQRSEYAAGAIRNYLENQELSRIAAEYDVDQAFPLRIEIKHIDTPDYAKKNGNPILGDPAFASEMGEVRPEISAAPDSMASPAGLPRLTTPVPESPGEENLQKTEFDSSVAVRQQLNKLDSPDPLPEFKAEFVSNNDIIIPSLLNPPMPLAQVVLAFLYIIPIFFVSVFFTSSFTEEKVNRKMVILLSAPVSTSQIILGKMLPYFLYSLLVIIAVTLFLHGAILTALAIFFPVMLFIFSIYLMVALTYRTFKDQTFFSVLALSLITVYLVVPAMFTGVSDLSYISPLTLAVEMYRGESFAINQYLMATVPLYLIFSLVLYLGTRVLNEEYLMGFKPLHVKVAEAIYLALNKKHLNISIFLLSLVLIPIVFAVQLVALVLITNLPAVSIIWFLMPVSIIIEEVAKSFGIFTLIKNRAVGNKRQLFQFAALSATAFWMGEKLLLFLITSITSETSSLTALTGTGMFDGWLLLAPLVLHLASTYVVCRITLLRRKYSYLLALLAGLAIHSAYNFIILFASGGIV
jgi:ABC-type Na+ efflux pump permease subunit